MASGVVKVRGINVDEEYPVFIGIHYIDAMREDKDGYIISYGSSVIRVKKEDGERLMEHWTARLDIIDCTKD